MEGHFRDIKENDNFQRFYYRTLEKMYKECMLYAIGRNKNKYHRFLHDVIKKFNEKQRKGLLRKAHSLKCSIMVKYDLKYS